MASTLGSALLGLAALAASSVSAEAAVVYSGVRNLPVPADPVGLWLNVVTGGYETPVPFFYPQGVARDGDLEIGGSFYRSLYTPTAGSQNTPGLTTSQVGFVIDPADHEQALNLAPGTPIGPSSLLDTGQGPYADEISNLTRGSALIGFRFRNELNGNTVHYGWARVILNDGTQGTLVDYGWESTPLTAIPAGATPEPASILAALAGMTLLRRRR